LLLNRLVDLAARYRIKVLQAEMLAQNQTMRRLLTRLQRPLSFKYESGSLRVRLELSGPIPA
jgi:hypothetical protein